MTQTLELGPTTSAGPKAAHQVDRQVLLGGALAFLASVIGTNAICSPPRSNAALWVGSDWTNATGTVAFYGNQRMLPDPAEALREIRRRTSLTWSQLAEILEVERRSLHLWFAGRGITTRNAQHLSTLLEAVRNVDLGDRAETAAYVLESYKPTGLAIETRAKGFRDRKLPRLSRDEREARRAIRLQSLLSAATESESDNANA